MDDFFHAQNRTHAEGHFTGIDRMITAVYSTNFVSTLDNRRRPFLSSRKPFSKAGINHGDIATFDMIDNSMPFRDSVIDGKTI
jgi:hypothetical protein